MDARGKILIIGGGIANFTDVKKTFKGIVRALNQFAEKLIEGNVKIWVRRGGPNYQDGLKLMKQTGDRLGLQMQVYGPETHITAIVPMSLGIKAYNEGVNLGSIAKLHPTQMTKILTKSVVQQKMDVSLCHKTELKGAWMPIHFLMRTQKPLFLVCKFVLSRAC